MKHPSRDEGSIRMKAFFLSLRPSLLWCWVVSDCVCSAAWLFFYFPFFSLWRCISCFMRHGHEGYGLLQLLERQGFRPMIGYDRIYA